MAEHLPAFAPGQDVTFIASAAVTGGQLVEVTGNMTVGPAGAASADVVGVASFDAGANVEVGVSRGGVHRLTASAAVAAGASVAATAAGTVATAATNPAIGIALEAIDANATGRVALSIS